MFWSPQGRTGPHKPYGIPKDFYTFQPLASTRANKRDFARNPMKSTGNDENQEVSRFEAGFPSFRAFLPPVANPLINSNEYKGFRGPIGREIMIFVNSAFLGRISGNFQDFGENL